MGDTPKRSCTQVWAAEAGPVPGRTFTQQFNGLTGRERVIKPPDITMLQYSLFIMSQLELNLVYLLAAETQFHDDQLIR